jgi:hypothetical protein
VAQAPSLESTPNNALIAERLSVTNAFLNGKEHLPLNKQLKDHHQHQLTTRQLAFAQPIVSVNFGKGFSTIQ